jgi:hypothetical protein
VIKVKAPTTRCESVSMLRERNSTDIHPEKTRDEVDRQRQHRNECQYEQGAVGLLLDGCRELFLQ